jgi:Protein of unknown function (DUF2971)
MGEGVEDAKGLEKKRYPTYLYRYRSFDTAYAFDEIINALNSRKLFLASAASMNDPFDFRPIYKPSSPFDVFKRTKDTFGSKPILTREKASEIQGTHFSRQQYQRLKRRLRPSLETAKAQINAVRKHYQFLPERAKLACFSETGENIPMWAHYAKNHSGFCIKFRYDADIPYDPNQPAALKVKYGLTRPIITTLDHLEFTGHLANLENSSTSRELVFDHQFIYKNEQWSYEREWRMFVQDPSPQGYKRFDRLKIESIAVGIKTSDENIKKLRTVLEGKTALKKAVVASDSFSLDFLDL